MYTRDRTFGGDPLLCLADLPTEMERLAGLRDRLWSRLASGLDDVVCNGHPSRRLPGNLNVSFGGVEADGLLLAMKDVALSTGSAGGSNGCSGAAATRALTTAIQRAPRAGRGGHRG